MHQTVEEYAAAARAVLHMLDPGPEPRINGGFKLFAHWQMAKQRYAKAHYLLLGEPLEAEDTADLEILRYGWREWSDWVTAWESQYNGMHRARVVELADGVYAAFVDNILHDSYDDLDEAKTAIRAHIEALTGLDE